MQREASIVLFEKAYFMLQFPIPGKLDCVCGVLNYLWIFIYCRQPHLQFNMSSIVQQQVILLLPNAIVSRYWDY